MIPSDPVERAAEWALRVASLNAELHKRNPKRARGGRDAFAGFAFQIHAALLEFVRALAADQDGGNPSFGYEQVADFVLATDDVLYTHEVKLTLTRGTLCRALDVFQGVKVAALETDFDTSERLRFRLVSRNSALSNVVDIVEAWVKRQDETEIAQSVVEALHVLVTKQPRHELYALLASQFRIKKPSQLVDRWVKRIVDEAVHHGELLGTYLIDDIYEAADEDSLPFALLSANDCEPCTVDRRNDGFLVGEQPTLHHLRSGFFASGFKAGQVEEQFWRWYEGLVSDAAISLSGRVPVFWIEGASGSGKSILLLQLLARLNAKNFTTVAWLSGSTDQLSSAARFARDIGAASTVIIGIDDPYSSDPQCDSHWNLAMSHLNAIRQTDDFERIPIFICCGPSDHLERFRDRQYHNAIITNFINSPPTSEETERLREWFRCRTGETRDLPVSGSRTLPAQLFFEWWKNEGIISFALRFRDRVSGLGAPVRDLIDQVLALNRIYIGYPNDLKQSLSPESLDAFDVLERDLHFETRRTGRAGYWLSHPHLANILYNAWYPEATAINVRTSHLTRTLIATLGLPDRGRATARILSAVLAASIAGQATELRVRESVVRGTVGTVGPLAAEHAKENGFAFLAVWIHASVAAPKAMAWTPVKTALRMLTVDSGEQAGRTELLTAMVESGDPDAASRVREIAEIDPHSRGWDTVMRALLTSYPPSELADAISNGARLYPQDRDRIALLEQAMEMDPNNPKLNASGIELLAQDDPTAMAGLARQMAGSTVLACRTAVFDWLSREPRLENGPSLVMLLRQRGTPFLVVPLAKTWLIRYPEASHADELFGLTIAWLRINQMDYVKALRSNLALGQKTPNSPVIKRMRSLLAGSPKHASWSYLFSLYCMAEVDYLALKELGISWLSSNVGVAQWNSVYFRLAEAIAAADSDLTVIGFAALDRLEAGGDPDDSWPSFMSSVLSVVDDEHRDAAVERALNWIETQPDPSDSKFGFALQQVIRQATRAAIGRALDLGLLWLRFNGAEVTWNYLWQLCWKSSRDDARGSLLDLADDWLETDHPGWGQVFRRVWASDGDHDRWLPKASKWLNDAHQSDQWPAVLSLVIDHLDQMQVIDLFVDWLKKAGAQDRSIGFVWGLLIDEGRYPSAILNPPLRPALTSWLRANSRSRSWWFAWKRLVSESPDSAKDLILAALQADLPVNRGFGVGNQLRRFPLTSPKGIAVSEALQETFDSPGPAWYPTWKMTSPRSEHFWSLGFRLLEAAAPNKFPYTWLTMWDSQPSSEARETLERLGEAWCATTRGSKMWPRVWGRLEQNWPLGAAPHIVEIAQSWLDDLVSRRFKERDEIMLCVQNHRDAMSSAGD